MSMEHRLNELEAEMMKVKSHTISLNKKRKFQEKMFKAESKIEESFTYELEM